MNIGQIIYDSFVFEKNNFYKGRYKNKKMFDMHINLWNCIMPCLLCNDEAQKSVSIEKIIQLLKKYTEADIKEKDFDCLYMNHSASCMLFVIILYINIELNTYKIDNKKINMLIRAGHNLPRCMINGGMYAEEDDCLKYSLDNLEESYKKSVFLLYQKINH